MVRNTHLRLASDRKQKTIIAMKGAPFTRKTEFATLIAASLRCPLLSVEDVLDFLGPDHVQTCPSPNTLTPPSQLAQDLAFQIICQMAKSHIWEGVSDKVVIDSPLSSRSHLDQLIKLVDSSMQKIRLVIVECKPENTYMWKMKFEQHLHQNPHPTGKWYKAQNWDEVIKETILHHDDDDERSDGYQVSKLTLDPLLDYLFMPPRVWSPTFAPPPFMKAIKYLMKSDGPDVVLYRQWQLNSCTPPNAAGESSQTNHIITKYTEELGLEYEEVKCMGCGKEFAKGGGAYSCNNCILALHKECAESFAKNSTWGDPCYKDLFGYPKYRFPQVFDCASCKENQKTFSDKCASCLFETHLKCRVMPTVIKHSCDEHFLSIVLLPGHAYQNVHMCLACGTRVEFVFYTCNICCTYYHFNCLNEIPIQVKHVHGGHHHQLLLKFSSDKAEDYICDECLEFRHPENWFYSCEDCHYEVQLDCILSKIKNGGSFVMCNSKQEIWGSKRLIMSTVGTIIMRYSRSRVRRLRMTNVICTSRNPGSKVLVLLL